jgi:hypothetical protein
LMVTLGLDGHDLGPIFGCDGADLDAHDGRLNPDNGLTA